MPAGSAHRAREFTTTSRSAYRMAWKCPPVTCGVSMAGDDTTTVITELADPTVNDAGEPTA
jgi:hypothetical protein